MFSSYCKREYQGRTVKVVPKVRRKVRLLFPCLVLFGESEREGLVSVM